MYNSLTCAHDYTDLDEISECIEREQHGLNTLREDDLTYMKCFSEINFIVISHSDNKVSEMHGR